MGVEPSGEPALLETAELLILGGGPAGLTAAIYGARSGIKTLVLERQMTGGQIATTDMVENFPGFPKGVGGLDLVEMFKEQALHFGAVIREIEEVQSFLPGETHHVVTGSGSYGGHAVILATGLDPQGLGCNGEDRFRGRGVSFCATCDGAFFRDRIVAVVGGGNSAVEEALFLTRFARKVYLIHRRDKLRADWVLQKRALDHPKIEALWTAQVREVRGEDKVESILVDFTDRGETRDISVDGVFLYVGQRPNTGFVRDLLQTDQSGFIMTNHVLATSLAGVYAAGDCRLNPMKQVVWAAAEGALAAQEAGRYLEEQGVCRLDVEHA